MASGATAVGVCGSTLGSGSTDQGYLVSGDSLTRLVDLLNSEDRYDGGGATCTSQDGAETRVVFRYANGRTLPVLVSADTCRWSDNGAQQRLGAAWMGWLENLELPQLHKPS